MARPRTPPAERPVQIIGAELRLYASEPELLAFFAQYKPRQYAAAIKRAVRAALTGGTLGLGPQFAPPAVDDDDDAFDFSQFVS